ncbi:MAG: DUF72 domain-containing protein [Actinomycetota bacterium]|nr:DUF72 domain-containing protein [Actinomycetota bacterium]
MAAQFCLGTSGFAYDEWKGIFYPADLKDSEMLPFYGTRFHSVEINYTYRRIPEEATVRRWAEQVPEGFRFALKANQRITHFKRLRDAGEDLREFVRLARLLGQRLGPILIQCPPNLGFDRELLDRFLDILPEDVMFAMEFRHPSWSAARDILAQRGVGWCLAETEEHAVDRSSLPGGPFVYLRLRKEDYTDDDLRVWAGSISRALGDGRDVHCYLKHEEKAVGPRFAARLGELVDEVSRGSATR